MAWVVQPLLALPKRSPPKNNKALRQDRLIFHSMAVPINALWCICQEALSEPAMSTSTVDVIGEE